MDDGVEEYHHIWIGDAVLVGLLVGLFLLGHIIYYIIKDNYITTFADAFAASSVYFLVGGAIWFVVMGMYILFDYYGDTPAECSILMLIIYGIIIFLVVCCAVLLGILCCVLLGCVFAVPVYFGKNWRRWKAARALKKAKNTSRIECLETKIHSLQEEVVSLRGKDETCDSFPDASMKTGNL